MEIFTKGQQIEAIDKVLLAIVIISGIAMMVSSVFLFANYNPYWTSETSFAAACIDVFAMFAFFAGFAALDKG